VWDQDRDGGAGDDAHRRKAARKSTGPQCGFHAWAQPEANLVCEDCGATMEPEVPEED